MADSRFAFVEQELLCLKVRTYRSTQAFYLQGHSYPPIPPPSLVRATREERWKQQWDPKGSNTSKHQIIQIYFSVGCLHFHVSRYPISCKLTGSPTYLLDASWCHPAGKGEDKVRQNLGQPLCSKLFWSISKAWRVAEWLRRQIWGRPRKGCVIGWCGD